MGESQKSNIPADIRPSQKLVMAESQKPATDI